MAGLNELKSWVIQVNKRLTERTGENHALLRPESLESALGSLGQSWYNDEQAIASCYKSLILNHPFENGNKRTAVAVLQALKQPILSGNEVYSLTVKIASEGGGKIEVNEIANALFGTNYPVIKPRLDKLSTDPINRRGWSNPLVKGKKLKEDDEFDDIKVSDEPVEVTTLDTIIYPKDIGKLPYANNSPNNERKYITNVIIEDGTTEILPASFAFCSNLTSIKFPIGLKKILYGAFYGTGLTHVELPRGLELLNSLSFSNCQSLKSIIIPRGVILESEVFNNSREDLVIYCEDVIQPNNWDRWWNPRNNKVVWGYRLGDPLLEDVDNKNEFDTIEVSDEPVEVTEQRKVYNYPEDNEIKLDNLEGATYTDIVVTEGTKVIKPHAFSNLFNVYKVTIPDSVEIIGSGAFRSCRSLVSVTLPDTIVRINDFAFGWCAGLESITFPINLRVIEAAAFVSCESLKSIVLPDSVEIISENAFRWCSSLKSATLSVNLRILDEQAFGQCHELESVIIPGKLQYMDATAFYDCPKLNHIEYGGMVFESPEALHEYITDKDIDFMTFTSVNEGVDNKDEFDDIEVSDEPAEVTVIDFSTIVYPRDMGKIPLSDALTRSYVKKVVFEPGLIEIGYGAFARCSGLESVQLPSTLKQLRYGAFFGCSNLKTVIVPDGVKTIEGSAFAYCDSLVSIYIPDSVIDMSGWVFEGVSGDKELTIYCASASQPSSWNDRWNRSGRDIRVIWGASFSGTHLITEGDEFDDIEVSDEPVEVGEINKTYYYPDMEDIAMSRNDKNSYTHVVVQPGTVRINDGAFYAFNMAYVSIPDSVTLIGWGAFDSCKSLKSIILPKHIANTGYQAFQFCESLETVIIPDSVTRISAYTFRGCKSLKSITLPESVTEIGNSAFSDCSSLKQIVVPNNVTSISSSAFSGCTSLESVTLPNRINVINFGTFQGCTALKSIVIPDTVTTVSHLAFKDCNKLKSFIYKGQTYKSSLALRRAIKNEHDLNNPDQWAAL